MKKMRIATVYVLMCMMVIVLFGCGSVKRLQEEKLYKEAYTDFFAALDARDADKMKSLFSKAVLEQDEDLDLMIEKMFSSYSKAESKVMFDGNIHGEYTDEDGKHQSIAYSTIPVYCGNEYYWVELELIYEDDFNPDHIGLNTVCFYTADEYYAFFSDDAQVSEDLAAGLHVYADLDIEGQIRCIDQIPVLYTEYERSLRLGDVEAFLKTNVDMDTFIENFGQSNAVSCLYENEYYYALEDENEKLYLEIYTENRQIVSVAVVNEMGFVKSILEAK